MQMLLWLEKLNDHLPEILKLSSKQRGKLFFFAN